MMMVGTAETGPQRDDATGSCAEAGERAGGVTGADAEAGALVWVIRRNGSWWPGRILSADELPEGCVPPRATGTPIKLLGRPDGSIDWYNLEKSKRVKPFRCGEFDECIENAKVRAHKQKVAYNEGRYTFREDAIMHALEIESSQSTHKGHLNTYGSCASIKEQVSKPTSQTTKCSKEGLSSIRDYRSYKMKIISFGTPISIESHKRHKSSLSLQSEGTMTFQALDSDAVGLDARVDSAVCKPTEYENNIKVYDVKLAVHGNYEGHRLPLAFLASQSTAKPIKGYPITVEVLEDSCPAASTDDYHPATSSLDCLMESKIPVPRQARSSHASQSKPSVRKKILGHDLDKSWRPHTKKPASSPRNMQSLSSYASRRRESANMDPASTDDHHRAISSLDGLMESEIPVPWQARSSHASQLKPSVCEKIFRDDLGKSWPPHTKKPVSSPRNMQSFSSYASSWRESASMDPIVEKGSPSPIRSTSKPLCSPRRLRSFSAFAINLSSSPRKMQSFSDFASSRRLREHANRKSVDAKGFQPPVRSPPASVNTSSTGEYYVKPTTLLAGSRGPLLFPSPAASSTRNINGCTAMYLCSASSVCAPVRLV